MTFTQTLRHATAAPLRAAAFAAIAFTLPAPAFAADHLEPEPSVFRNADWETGYTAMVADKLKDAMAPGVRAHVIVLPSFSNEYAIGLQQDGGAWRIVTLHLKYDLWLYYNHMAPDGTLQPMTGKDADSAEARYLAGLPHNYRDVPVARCDAIIDAALATRLVTLWTTMLLATRFANDGVIVTDGTEYHFSAFSQLDEMEAHTHSPDPSSKPGALVALTDAMDAYCASPTAQRLAELARQTTGLEKRLP